MAYTAGLIAREASEAFVPYGQKESDGTTILAAEFNGGVVLSADTRTSSGPLIVHRLSNKITEVSSHICVLRSGSSADTQAITDIVKYHLSVYEMEHGHPAPVHVAAQVFRDMCYRYRDDFTAGVIIAGWDNKLGGQVYQIPLGGMIVRRPLGAGGSGSTYIFGFLDENYRTGMTRPECEEFLKSAVALAVGRDGSSGGAIRLAVISEKGIERKHFTGEQIPKKDFDLS